MFLAQRCRVSCVTNPRRLLRPFCSFCPPAAAAAAASRHSRSLRSDLRRTCVVVGEVDVRRRPRLARIVIHRRRVVPSLAHSLSHTWRHTCSRNASLPLDSKRDMIDWSYCVSFLSPFSPPSFLPLFTFAITLFIWNTFGGRSAASDASRRPEEGGSAMVNPVETQAFSDHIAFISSTFRD